MPVYPGALLLQEGHLWGRKEVAIPVASISRAAAAGITVDLTREQIGDLPAVEIGHPGT